MLRLISRIFRSISPRASTGSLFAVLLLTLFFFSSRLVGASPPFDLRDGDRVLFLGDTLIEREGTTGYLEYVLTAAYPDRAVTFRNLGWSADLPTGQSRASFDWSRGEQHWFTNLLGQIAQVNPTVIFLGYGMAASFSGPAGVEKFTRDVNHLISGVRKETQATPVRFVLLGPIRHEDLGASLPDPARHNEDLARYSEALRLIADRLDSPFVDLFHDLALPAKGEATLTDNGIHLNARGYRRLAETLARALKQPESTWKVTLSAKDPSSTVGAGLKCSEVELTDHGAKFAIVAEHLPIPSPTMTPKSDTQEGMSVQIQGLKPGEYLLKLDGEELAVASASAWQTGIVLSQGAPFAQAKRLHQAILKKNDLFFNRWRPENSTYLFLFRKGEQGQNAREIPDFDPLITEQEAKIATLRKPKSHHFELIPVSKGHAVTAPSQAIPSATAPKIDPTPQPHPSFDLGPDLQISLYAENPKLYKPIQMNFDAKGRLWVASSSVYPQIKPGQTADDSIIVLEDRDGDGVAETSTVFADGLLIPTGVEPGDGGVYVGQSTELLHFKDTDGDGHADVRRTVLSGFGTEDTHHILHTLHWGMDGQLYMNQSIYIHTHTETPNGVVRLNSGGILNLRPDTLELGIHMKGLVNSWGHQFDLYGQSFATDGAGGEGINYIVPQAMYFTYAGARRILGSVSPGSYPKFCSLEILQSPAFPADWQGNMITCDFRAHRVVRFAISEQGSAYVTQELPDVVRSQDATFRPIDVKMGPDGALYIADWSNPIIQHGEVDFRDPRRDHEHGRIWRVTHRGSPLVPRRDLTTASNPELLSQLIGSSGYHREKARRVLTERGKEVLPAVKEWMAGQTDERAHLEGLWLYQALDVVNAPLLTELLSAHDGRIRAAAVRILSFWRQRVSPEVLKAESRTQRFETASDLNESERSRPLELLGAGIADEHPRVRLEALRGLAKFPTARAAELALSVLEKPMDPHLDYALWLTINDLAEPWIAAVKSGSWRIEGREKQLEYGLRAIEPGQAGAVMSQILAQHPLDHEGSGKWIELIGQAGGADDLGKLFEHARKGSFSDAATIRALNALDQAARLRKVTPNSDLSAIADLFQHSNAEIQIGAVRLAGGWKRLGSRIADLSRLAGASATSAPLLTAALDTLRDIGGQQALDTLSPLCAPTSPLAVRRQAVVALAALKPALAASAAVQTLQEIGSEAEALILWRSLLGIKGSAAPITHALPKSGISPAVARAGLRAARESGRNEPDLVLALTRGADLAEGEASLSDAELKEMAVAVIKQGDAHRGEQIYRRAQLACTVCHAIGGAGGRVGPDMTSIGASAPVDYLIESVWFPNRKVKEGFNSLLLETKDGQELNGILVREDGERVVMRDSSGAEITVAKNNIEKRAIGGSLMPAGLIDGLTPGERLDLFRFLSELGKPGSYDASKGNVARGWKMRPGNHQDEQFGVEKMVAIPLTDRSWITVWSQVDGQVTKPDLELATNVHRYVGLIGIYAATQLQIAKAGTVQLALEGGENASVWMDGKPVPTARDIRVDLAVGTHTVVIRLDPKRIPEHLRLGSSDGTFVMP